MHQNIPEIPVKSQMNHILQYWLRTQKCNELPTEIIHLIIDIYAYQSVFDREHQHKPKNKSQPKLQSTSTSTNSKGLPYDYLFKILLIGDRRVGKSALVQRFRNDTFTDSYTPTIGVDFAIKTIDIDGKRITLKISDTGAQERFRTIRGAYYTGAKGILIVYDVHCRSSFDNVTQWNAEIDKYCNDNVCKVLVGNKRPLIYGEGGNEVKEDEAKRLCKKLNITTCVETSARSTENVTLAFETLGKQIYQNREIYKKRQLMPFYG